MALFFTISNKFRFNIEIVIDTEIFNKSNPQIVRDILNSVKKITKMQQEFNAARRKIIGQSRIDYIAALDNLFIHLVVLRRNLRQYQDNDAEEAESSEEHYNVPLDFQTHRISSRGRLQQKDLVSVDNFSSSFNSKVLEKIRDLMVKYREFVASGHSSQEIENIYKIFDEVFYNILLLRNHIEYIE